MFLVRVPKKKKKTHHPLKGSCPLAYFFLFSQSSLPEFTLVCTYFTIMPASTGDNFLSSMFSAFLTSGTLPSPFQLQLLSSQKWEHSSGYRDSMVVWHFFAHGQQQLNPQHHIYYPKQHQVWVPKHRFRSEYWSQLGVTQQFTPKWINSWMYYFNVLFLFLFVSLPVSVSPEHILPFWSWF